MDNSILEAVKVLKEGGLILYPTDTIWGIGCDATNEKAVAKVYALKQREDSKSMLVLLDAPGKLQGYIPEIPDMAWDLIDIAQRPLTIIYPNARHLAKNLLADDGSVGIRISKERFSQALCAGLHRPIVSTSANISGKPTPKNFSQIEEEILSQVDYVVRYRQDDLSEAQPSSIIKLDLGNVIKVIRE